MTAAASQRRRVLSIDDNPTNLALIKVHLEKAGLTVLQATNGQDGLREALETKPDLILLDIMMPDMDGYQTCRQLKADERTAGIPVIFISARDQTTDKIQGLELGAIDYITKPFDPGELKARVGIVMQMIALQEKLQAQANTDELTGLTNRRRFLELLDREVLRSQMHGGSLCVAMVDIDHFKSINDSFGHLGGDVVLQQMAELLSTTLRPLDVVARYGGEEFVIIMPDTSRDQACHAAERLRRLVADCQWRISADPVVVTVSIGVAAMPSFGSCQGSDLINHADAALFVAKHRGRDQVIDWDGLADDERTGQIEQGPRSVRELEAQITDLNRRLRQQVTGSVAALCRVLEAQDPNLANHCRQVRDHALAIAAQLHLEDDFLDHLGTAATLHELDKLGRDTVLPAGQAAVSAQVLEPLGVFNTELRIIKYRHEHFDGSGQPEGLVGADIPFGARILAVADAFDHALNEHELSRSEAVELIQAGVGTIYDGDVVVALKKAIEESSLDGARNTPAGR